MTRSQRSRRNHSPLFKAKVALNAIQGEQTLAELFKLQDLHANQESDAVVADQYVEGIEHELQKVRWQQLFFIGRSCGGRSRFQSTRARMRAHDAVRASPGGNRIFDPSCAHPHHLAVAERGLRVGVDIYGEDQALGRCACLGGTGRSLQVRAVRPSSDQRRVKVRGLELAVPAHFAALRVRQAIQA